MDLARKNRATKNAPIYATKSPPFFSATEYVPTVTPTISNTNIYNGFINTDNILHVRTLTSNK